MPRLILVRLASLVGVLLGLSFAVFVVQRALPSDPVRLLVGRSATPEVIAATRTRLGLDEPLLTQYLGFLSGLLRGDAGTSLRTLNPVSEDLVRLLPATLELVAVAALMALLGGVLLGLLSSRGGWASALVRVLTVAGSSSATFLVAIVAVLVLYRNLGWFPAGGRSSRFSGSEPTGFFLIDTLLGGDVVGWLDALHHILLPAAVLAVGSTVAIGRTLRGSLRRVGSAEFIRSAQAKGFTWWQVNRRHALRNAANPALSMAGLQVGMLLSGSIVVELVFSWPGVGGYLANSISAADFPAIVGVVFVLGTGYVLINFVVDMLQLLVDPRLRRTR